MGDIVNLHKNKPHMEGLIRCSNCKYEWHGVAPVGLANVDCPKCESTKGFFVNPPMPSEPVFTCNCSNDVFYIGQNGPMCSHCGIRATGFDWWN